MERLISVAAAVLTVVCSQAQGAWLDPCTTARLVAAWKHEGLWRTERVYGPKSTDGHRLRFVGELRADGRAYRIYYDENATQEVQTQRGHKDLVVTSARGRFLGLYSLDDIDAEPTRIARADILFPPRKDDSGRSYRDRIHFGPKGPPKLVPILFGYDVGFGTPEGFLKDNGKVKPWPEPGPRVADYCRK